MKIVNCDHVLACAFFCNWGLMIRASAAVLGGRRSIPPLDTQFINFFLSYIFSFKCELYGKTAAAPSNHVQKSPGAFTKKALKEVK